jgi:hypothetical protein
VIPVSSLGCEVSGVRRTAVPRRKVCAAGGDGVVVEGTGAEGHHLHLGQPGILASDDVRERVTEWSVPAEAGDLLAFRRVQGRAITGVSCHLDATGWERIAGSWLGGRLASCETLAQFPGEACQELPDTRFAAVTVRSLTS